MLFRYADQVKVWLGDNADHYYVLSRFLLCRMLTVTKVPGIMWERFHNIFLCFC